MIIPIGSACSQAAARSHPHHAHLLLAIGMLLLLLLEALDRLLLTELPTALLLMLGTVTQLRRLVVQGRLRWLDLLVDFHL